MRAFSICIIAKNEEKNIERCLRSIQAFDCEIIVVDTGSTDRTVEIAQQYATKVLFFSWIHDFSAARNFSIAQASYDWVLILDCDEWVTESSPEHFMEFAAKYPDYIGLITRVSLRYPDSTVCSYTDKIGRFFNRNKFYYVGAIHEQLTPLTPHPRQGFELPLTLMHSGYIGTPEEILEKHRRNITILQQELAKDPDNPYWHFQLGQEFYNQADYVKAISYYEKVLSYNLSSDLEYLRISVQSYGECLIKLNRIKEALLLQNLEDIYGNIPDFRYLLGKIHLYNHDPLRAMVEFVKAVSLPNPRIEGTNSYLSWYFMGLINEELDNPQAAKTFFQKCGDFAPALEKLKN